MAECKVPEELSDEKTREDIPEEYVCSGPETTLQFLVARARDEKDYDTFKKALSVSLICMCLDLVSKARHRLLKLLNSEQNFGTEL